MTLQILRGFEKRPLLTKIVLIVVLTGLFITGLRIVDEPPGIQPLQHLSSSSHSDFDDYFQASYAFSRKDPDPYHTRNLSIAKKILEESGGSLTGLIKAMSMLKGVGSYLYPPFTAWVLAPLQGMDYRLSALIFLIVSVLCLSSWMVVSFYFAKRNGVDQNKTIAAMLLLVLIMFGLLNRNSANGNIGFILIMLCGIGVMFSFSDQQWLSALGGFLIGLACVMKITPVFLAGLLFGGRRFLALSGFVAGIIFALFIPGLTYGVQDNFVYLNDWYSLVIDSFQDVVFIRSWMNNQSLGGMIGRFFLQGQEVKQSAYGLPILVLPELAGPARNFYFAKVVKLLSAGFFLVLFSSTILLFLKDGWKTAIGSIFLKDKARTGLLDSGMIRIYTMIVISSQLMSGVSWYHSWGILVICLFPWWISLYAGQSIHLSGKFFFVFLFFFGFLYQFLPSVSRELLSIYSVFTLGMIVFFVWFGLEFFIVFYQDIILKKRVESGI